MNKTKKSDLSANTNMTRTLYWISILSAVAALFVHGYLLNQHIEVTSGAATGPSMCDVNAIISCSAVAASKYSEFLGVPIALWGILANITAILFLLWHPLVETEKKSASLIRIFLISGVIGSTSLVMFSISVFALAKYCLFCIAAYLLSFVLLGSVYVNYRNDLKSAFEKFRGADLIPLGIAAAITLLAGFIVNDKIRSSYGIDELTRFAKESVATWSMTTPREIALIDPLVMGASKEQAKMTIVEFADFRCIHCKMAAPGLKAFTQAHPEVRLEFQPWPLDGECNASVPTPNGASCLLARIVWCADKKAKTGWAAHEYIYEQEIFMSKDAVLAAIDAIAKPTKMSAADLRQCAESDDAKNAVRHQAEVGSALGLQGTPGIYVNGKVLQGGQSVPVLREALLMIQK